MQSKLIKVIIEFQMQRNFVLKTNLVAEAILTMHIIHPSVSEVRVAH